MRSIIRGALALLILALALPAQAAVRVLATTADWGALATELGGERVDVYVATSALQDVHRVDAKPSLVARARTANLARRQRRRARSRLAAGSPPGIRQCAHPARRAGLLRGDGFAAKCSKFPRASTARSATSIRRAIRTCSSIHGTSTSSQRHWRRNWLRSIRPAPRTTPRAPANSQNAGTRPSADGRAGRRRSRACRS